MPLHSILPDAEVPSVLKRPLKFGDREQIEALNEIDSRLHKIATEKALMESGEMKMYQVSIEVSYDETFDILAVSKADAIEKAQDDFEPDDCDFEYFWSAREIKLKKGM